MISQLFILAPNGHTIVHKDYRGEVPKEASEVFLRMMVEQATGSPVFTVEYHVPAVFFTRFSIQKIMRGMPGRRGKLNVDFTCS